jgi:hypothetical protein
VIALILITFAVILAVAFLADARQSGSGHAMSEEEAADRLRPRSGTVEAAPQQPPVK